MSLDRPTRIDRVLPELFAELAAPRTPDYLEDAIDRASSRRQRPAWTFPGRWLPMEITSKAAPAARVPWRTIGALALIALLVAATAIAIVGSRRTDTPAPPFGLAGNGPVAFEVDGDIVRADPVTGEITPVITGPEVDTGPVYSPDGSHIAFRRASDAAGDAGLLFVAREDGSDLVQVTPEPVLGLTWWTFSPDGSLLLVTSVVGSTDLTLYETDGSGTPTEIEYFEITDEPPSFRPPDGREILFGSIPAGGYRGIYAYDVATRQVRPIVEPIPNLDLNGPTWSADGTQVLFGGFDPNGDGVRTKGYVVNADGSGMRRWAPEEPAVDAIYAMSNDGTRLVYGIADTGGVNERTLVVPADDPSTGVELRCGETCADFWTWSPDDTRLFGSRFQEEDGTLLHLIADPATGTVTEAPWQPSGEVSWQRLAP